MTDRPSGGLAPSLLRAADWFNDALVSRLEQAGWPRLNRSQSLTFANLDEAGTRPAELARRVGISRQSMQVLLADLAAQDLVVLDPDPQHGRAKLVRLTRRGRRLVDWASQTLIALEAELADRIGAAAVDDLRAALNREWGPPPLSGDAVSPSRPPRR